VSFAVHWLFSCGVSFAAHWLSCRGMRFIARKPALLLAGLWLLASPAEAQRVVTMAPFLTELVFASGAGDKLVGVAAHSDYPAQARKLPVVADATGANRETLLALRPDVVLAWRTGTPAGAIESLRQAGINVVVMDGARIDDVPKLLRQVGVLTDTRARSEQSAAAFESALKKLRGIYAAKPRVRAMFEIWHAPLMTISGNHFMTDALEVCGGSNVFNDLASIAPEVSLESVIAKDPQAIIGAGSALDEKTFRANWSRFESLRAVKAGALIYLNPDTIQRQTPRLLDGVKALCEGLETVRSGSTARGQ